MRVSVSPIYPSGKGSGPSFSVFDTREQTTTAQDINHIEIFLNDRSTDENESSMADVSLLRV